MSDEIGAYGSLRTSDVRFALALVHLAAGGRDSLKPPLAMR